MFPLIGPFFSIISAFLAFFRKWRKKLKIPSADFQTLEAGIESLPQTSLWHTRNTSLPAKGTHAGKQSASQPERQPDLCPDCREDSTCETGHELNLSPQQQEQLSKGILTFSLVTYSLELANLCLQNKFCFNHNFCQ